MGTDALPKAVCMATGDTHQGAYDKGVQMNKTCDKGVTSLAAYLGGAVLNRGKIVSKILARSSQA